MEVGLHAHWIEDLPVNLGQTGCMVSGYVCVPLLECDKDASQFCSVDRISWAMAIGFNVQL
eukprot:1145497-Pelagomonas_calceolata.AAC.1